MADGPVRLNIGCGKKLLPGYVNCDLPNNWSGITPDVECDVLALPFPDSHADEVLAVHVLEHLYLWQAEAAIREWVRVLKPGGKLALELPCFEKIMRLANDPAVRDDPPSFARLVKWGLYGDPNYKSVEMTHKWCYSKPMLRQLLKDAGLSDVRIVEPVYHIAIRDMRAEGTKC